MIFNYFSPPTKLKTPQTWECPLSRGGGTVLDGTHWLLTLKLLQEQHLVKCYFSKFKDQNKISSISKWQELQSLPSVKDKN